MPSFNNMDEQASVKDLLHYFLQKTLLPFWMLCVFTSTIYVASVCCGGATLETIDLTVRLLSSQKRSQRPLHSLVFFFTAS